MNWTEGGKRVCCCAQGTPPPCSVCQVQPCHLPDVITLRNTQTLEHLGEVTPLPDRFTDSNVWHMDCSHANECFSDTWENLKNILQSLKSWGSIQKILVISFTCVLHVLWRWQTRCILVSSALRISRNSELIEAKPVNFASQAILTLYYNNVGGFLCFSPPHCQPLSRYSPSVYRSFPRVKKINNIKQTYKIQTLEIYSCL